MGDMKRHCKRCGVDWLSRGDIKEGEGWRPVKCPRCQSLKWDEESVEVRAWREETRREAKARNQRGLGMKVRGGIIEGWRT